MCVFFATIGMAVKEAIEMLNPNEMVLSNQKVFYGKSEKFHVHFNRYYGVWCTHAVHHSTMMIKTQWHT